MSFTLHWLGLLADEKENPTNLDYQSLCTSARDRMTQLAAHKGGANPVMQSVARRVVSMDNNTGAFDFVASLRELESVKVGSENAIQRYSMDSVAQLFIAPSHSLCLLAISSRKDPRQPGIGDNAISHCIGINRPQVAQGGSFKNTTEWIRVFDANTGESVVYDRDIGHFVPGMIKSWFQGYPTYQMLFFFRKLTVSPASTSLKPK